MIICITSGGNTIESNLDARFGRCSYFVIIDLKTNTQSIIENEAGNSGGGAGISSGQFMIEKGVEAVITGNVGPNAMKVLEAASIEIYRGENTTVKDNLDKYKAGLLKKITETVPAHSGMAVRI
ncbi:MAG: NifB/NifX family molybdenum-iron cluster-binding protein [Eubacteriales bacterium]